MPARAAVSSADARRCAAATAPATRGARRAARLLALALLTVVGTVVWGLGTALLLPLASARRRWRLLAFRTWARSTLRVLAVRVSVHGLPPKAPFLLVANHLSYLDVIVLASVVPAAFVAKHEVRAWPVLGALARAMGTLFIDRARPRDAVRVIQAVEGLRARGEGVVVFPEGTTTPGDHIAPLRPALLAGAARHGRPVHHATLSYRTAPGDPPARMAVCWWGGMRFGPHVLGLCALGGIDAVVAFGPMALTDPDRKRLGRRLHRALRRRFTPVS